MRGLSHHLFNAVDYLFTVVDYLFGMVEYLFGGLSSLKLNYLPIFSLNTEGGIPNSSENTRLKNFGSLKPVSYAISAMPSAETSSMSRAFCNRISRMYKLRERPVSADNLRYTTG